MLLFDPPLNSRVVPALLGFLTAYEKILAAAHMSIQRSAAPFALAQVLNLEFLLPNRNKIVLAAPFLQLLALREHHLGFLTAYHRILAAAHMSIQAAAPFAPALATACPLLEPLIQQRNVSVAAADRPLLARRYPCARTRYPTALAITAPAAPAGPDRVRHARADSKLLPVPPNVFDHAHTWLRNKS